MHQLVIQNFDNSRMHCTPNVKKKKIVFLLCHFYNFELLFKVLNSVLLIFLKKKSVTSNSGSRSCSAF